MRKIRDSPEVESVKARGGTLEGPVAEGAAEVEALVGGEEGEGVGEALSELGGPAGAEGEDAGENRAAANGGAAPSTAYYGKPCQNAWRRPPSSPPRRAPPR